MRLKRFPVLLAALIAALLSLIKLAHADSPPAAPVDEVKAGDEAGERDHKMKGDQTDTQQVANLTARTAGTNGWFSWELHVLPDTAQELDVDYGGGRRTAADTVQILVDDTRLGTVRLGGGQREEYYPLTADAVKGKNSITVKFQAGENSRISGVYGVRVMKLPTPTIASLSKASSTRTNYQYIVNVINDLHEAKSSGDRFKKHFDWWPAKATNQWVQYDFEKPARVSAVEIYWFDDFDTGVGDCTPPKSWQVLFRQNGEWKPVTGASAYGVEKDKYNRTTFDAVETDGLRLDVLMPDRHSSGLLQWKVE